MPQLEIRLLLNAYFERLHDRLWARRTACQTAIDRLLDEELHRRAFSPLDPDRRAACREAAHAFLAERLETYDPVGLQYLFDQISAREAFRFEMQMNWYDARPEYQRLVETARGLLADASAADPHVPLDEPRLGRLADQLIAACGAFPNASIIAAYQADPALNHLPDYLVARALELLLHTT